MINGWDVRDRNSGERFSIECQPETRILVGKRVKILSNVLIKAAHKVESEIESQKSVLTRPRKAQNTEVGRSIPVAIVRPQHVSASTRKHHVL